MVQKTFRKETLASSVTEKTFSCPFFSDQTESLLHALCIILCHSMHRQAQNPHKID